MNTLNSRDSQPRCREDGTSSLSNEKWENLYLFILISLLSAPQHKTGLQFGTTLEKKKQKQIKIRLSFRVNTNANNSFSISAMSFLLPVYFTYLLDMQLLWQNLFSGEKRVFLQEVYAFSKLFPNIYLGLPHGFIFTYGLVLYLTSQGYALFPPPILRQMLFHL